MTHENQKKINLILILLALLCLLYACLASAQTSTSEISEMVENYETNFYEQEFKYSQIPKTKYNDSTYQVIEYVMPSGSAGYQILINDGLSFESIGYGAEAYSRTWIIPLDQASRTKEQL